MAHSRIVPHQLMLGWAAAVFLVFLSVKLTQLFRHRLNYKSARHFVKVKPVLITGASSGLGRALAINLFEKDAMLYLCARNKDELEATAEMCRREYIKTAWERARGRVEEEHFADELKARLADRIKLFSVDLLSEQEMVDFTRQLQRDQISFSFAFLNAGVGFQSTFASYATCQRVFSTNLSAQAFLALNIDASNLVFVASPQAMYPVPNRSLYAASKAGLAHFAACLRMDGRRCTCAYSRWFVSNLRAHALGEGDIVRTAARAARTAETVAANIVTDAFAGRREADLGPVDRLVAVAWRVAPALVEVLIRVFCS